MTRSKRLKLVVQLRRFLVLEATRRPNLASQCLGAVRGHWSVENRNHHKRAASAWQEDRHRRRQRKPNAALNLALTRNVLLALIPGAEGEPRAHFFERSQRHPPDALRLILKTHPVL